MSSCYSTFDEYGFRYLPLHLVRDGRADTLLRLIGDYAWLRAKLDATDSDALITDYERLPDDTGLLPIRDTLRLSASVLNRDKAQLASQLVGRLMLLEDAAIQAILEQAQHRGAGAR